MKIPLPCEFGKVSNCNGKLLPLQGVQWFQWQRGIEYTYFFVQNSIWHPTDFYTTFEKNRSCHGHLFYKRQIVYGFYNYQ